MFDTYDSLHAVLQVATGVMSTLVVRVITTLVVILPECFSYLRTLKMAPSIYSYNHPMSEHKNRQASLFSIYTLKTHWIKG